jgi:hypothetical protein
MSYRNYQKNTYPKYNSFKRKRDYYDDYQPKKYVNPYFVDKSYDDIPDGKKVLNYHKYRPESNYYYYNDRNTDNIPEHIPDSNPVHVDESIPETIIENKKESNEPVNVSVNDSIVSPCVNQDDILKKIDELLNESIKKISSQDKPIYQQPVVNYDPLVFFVKEIEIARVHITQLHNTCLEQEKYIKKLEKKLKLEKQLDI